MRVVFSVNERGFTASGQTPKEYVEGLQTMLEENGIFPNGILESIKMLDETGAAVYSLDLIDLSPRSSIAA